MKKAIDFVRDRTLPDIECRTNTPEEIVSPRVVDRDGVAMVYIHKERDHQGHVPVSEFLDRLASKEPGLSATGYRANGRQTTISFNKADRVSLSEELQGYLDRIAAQPILDTEAQSFLDGFLDPGNPQFVDWLPRYVDTLGIVHEAMEADEPDAIFELIWKSVDNAVSNAGQGVLGFEAADRMRGPLVEMIRAIGADGSPEQFEAMVGQLERFAWRGALPKTPRLLLARAFAAIHPDRYHTTVDAEKQEQILPWFALHTGFVAPQGNWANKAEALTTHLSRLDAFVDDRERRNMFPWFVFDQLRDSSGNVRFQHGHTTRAVTGQASGKAALRTIEYRQNVIQERLFELLCKAHGYKAVATEHPTGTGGRADALVQRPDGARELYEIKPASSAREAVRQALGQLLEYAYRRNGLKPVALHVVSDAPMDEVTQEYLQSLESRFGLKLGYMQIDSGLGEAFDE